MTASKCRRGPGLASNWETGITIPFLQDETTPEPQEYKSARPKQCVKNLDSMLTEQDLEHIRARYFIPTEYTLRVPPFGMKANARLDRKTLILYVEDYRAGALKHSCFVGDLEEKIRSLIKNRDTHSKASLRASAQVDELSSRVEEGEAAVCQARADVVCAKENVDFATRAVNDMLMRQSDLILAKPHSRFLEGDWASMSEVDVYKDLEIKEVELAGGNTMSVDAPDHQVDTITEDTLTGAVGGAPIVE
ncbi:hypothetical protein JCGZ_15423 [Jatropha curcas]|uniref:Uncharacterized protein n=1 Tax=Jatropha curcas TaxID=180498 RepID=A0A067K8Z1_JATCU|nr:hypothetical protein JCGZ_15423 [Jatropha curcas]